VSFLRRRAALALALVAGLALAVAVPLAVRARRRADEERAFGKGRLIETFHRLKCLETIIAEAREEGLSLPETHGVPSSESGLDVLVDGLRKARVEHPTTGIEWVHAGGSVAGNHVSRFDYFPDVDMWGRAIRYRCPGVVHTHGWDLYSVGPNGIDEGGEGDDIVVGEDIAPSTSGS
jgi:hypothetical protein